MKRKIQIAMLVIVFSAFGMVNAQDTTTPRPRGYHHMAVDTESEQVILFGGQFSSLEASPETWAFDLAMSTWQHMEPESGPPFVDTMIYHSPSDRVIAFAGSYWYGLASEPPAVVAQKTWIYDLNSNTWTELETDGEPGATIGARMVYDSESDRLILFGGLEIEPLLDLFAGESATLEMVNETWSFDPNTNTWTQMNPPVSPEGRNYHAMAYDPTTDRAYIYSGGGLSDGEFNYTDDMWAYDYNTDTWEEVELEDDVPHPREYSAMVYDEVGQQLILYGGYNEVEGELFGDTWAFDPQAREWAELSPENAPIARGWHAMVYDDITEAIMIFGGGVDRDTFVNETWRFNSSMNSWSVVSGDE